jgi:hypothetical protein
MNTTQYYSTMARLRRRVATGTLALALSLAGSPLIAGEAASHPRALSLPPQQTGAGDIQAAPANRIHGRLDWDTDYPSQLAPQSLLPRLVTGPEATGVTPLPAASSTRSDLHPSIASSPQP